MEGDISYDYVDDATISDALLCSITCEVLSNPVVLPCDHTFSKAGLEDEVQRQRTYAGIGRPNHTTCPLCAAPFTWPKDAKPVSRLITSLLDGLIVRCSHKSWSKHEPCNWTGPRDRLAGHLANDCALAAVTCPHKGCGRVLERHELAQHVDDTCLWRLVDAECGCKVQQNHLLDDESHHSLTCDDWPRDCPDCHDTTTRATMDAHGDVCPARVHTCAMRDLGCKFQGAGPAGLAHAVECPVATAKAHLDDVVGLAVAGHASKDHVNHAAAKLVVSALAAAAAGDADLVARYDAALAHLIATAPAARPVTPRAALKTPSAPKTPATHKTPAARPAEFTPGRALKRTPPVWR